MFRVTRYPMISKTESGRVGYHQKYRVAGRVRVPAGHWLFIILMYKASGRPYICSRLKSRTVVRHVYNLILLSSSLDYEHPISSTWLLCHLPFAPPSDILSSKLFQIYTSFALGALPIYRREQVSLLFKSVNDRLYSVCWNLAIGKPSLRTFMLRPIKLLIKGK